MQTARILAITATLFMALSGHHAQIERWRLKESLGRTWLRRPDLIEKRGLSALEKGLLEEFRRERQKDA